MSSILNNKHSPPNAMVDNPTVATPKHSPPAILTESSVAKFFQQRYRGRIWRVDVDDKDSGFIVTTLMQDGVAIIDGTDVPNSFVIAKIRQLIEELSVGVDMFTAIRINSYDFVLGVFRFLQIDPAMTVEHERNQHSKDYYSNADRCAERRYA